MDKTLSSVSSVKLSPALTGEEIKAWEHVFDEGEKCRWQADAAIYKPGDISAGIHFCLSGTYRTTAFSLTGKQRTLWLMRANSLIGEIAMLTDTRTIYFMECQESGETMFFARKKLFEKIFPQNPAIQMSIMRILATKLKMQSEDAQAFNFMPVWKRVGMFLLQRHAESDGPIVMSHARIAEFLGLHRVTVTKAIAALKRRGLVECSPGSIRLEDPGALESLLRD